MNINEFLEKTSSEYSLEEVRLSADDMDRDFRILFGQDSSVEIIDSAKKLKTLIDRAKMGKLPPGMFKGDMVAKAKEVEEVMNDFSDEEITHIVNKVDDSGLSTKEKIIFNFASQAEDFMVRLKKDKYLKKSDTGSTSAEAVALRSFNIIPVQFKLGDEYYYGIVRAPEGVITWQRAIDKWNDLGLVNADAEEIEREYADLAKLPKKLDVLETSPGFYRIDQTDTVRQLINDGLLDYDDSQEAKQQMVDTVVDIMSRNKKYQDMSSEEIEEVLRHHDVKTWAIDNVDFWKSVKDVFDD